MKRRAAIVFPDPTGAGLWIKKAIDAAADAEEAIGAASVVNWPS
ncbi:MULTISPECIES: hypothetical protein [unclassified Rhizobium]|nr:MULTISPECIES: hypothetical protein [unclassified Rhizobium]MCV9943809.1 hypothetical protein [Rhizobium sp. BT-175]MCW0017373.1 hypothetical protein [Rhizobium sp. BT-226]